MTLLPDSAVTEAARIRALHEERAKAELAAADALARGSDAVAWRGCLIPDVVLLKGLPGPAEAAGGPAVSGADGSAAEKALERLGHDPEASFFALTRPEPGVESAQRIARVRALVEAVDPLVVIAMDPEAAEDLAAAHGLDRLVPGMEVRAAGRSLVALEGLEASLSDERLKKRVWKQLQAAAPRGPVY